MSKPQRHYHGYMYVLARQQGSSYNHHYSGSYSEVVVGFESTDPHIRQLATYKGLGLRYKHNESVAVN